MLDLNDNNDLRFAPASREDSKGRVVGDRKCCDNSNGSELMTSKRGAAVAAASADLPVASRFNRRILGAATWLGVALLAAGVAVPSPAPAQSYPSETIKLVVPWPAGGGADTLGRKLAERLSQRL